MNPFAVVALAAARKDLLRRMRDPLALLLWAGIPLMIGSLIFLISGPGGNVRPRGKLLIVDRDKGFVSQALGMAFGRPPLSDLFEPETLAEDVARARIAKGEASALLVIPAGFGKALLEDTPTALELVKNPSQRILPRIAGETLDLLVDAVFYAQRIAADPLREQLKLFALGPPAGTNTFPDPVIAQFSTAINRTVERLSKLLLPPVIDVVIEKPPRQDGAADPPSFGALFFPTMLFMALFFIAQGIADDVWREKAQGTLRRGAMQPLGLAPLFAGKLLAGACVLGAVAGVAMCAAAAAFGLTWSRVPLATLWLVGAGAGLISFFVLIQMLASSQRFAQMLVNFLMFPLIMIGGAFFPFEAMPAWMADVGRRTPNGWALERFKDILFARSDAVALALGFALMVLFVLVLSLVSIRRMTALASR